MQHIHTLMYSTLVHTKTMNNIKQHLASLHTHTHTHTHVIARKVYSAMGVNTSPLLSVRTTYLGVHTNGTMLLISGGLLGLGLNTTSLLHSVGTT